MPLSSDFAFFVYFAFILKLGVMYVWHAGDDEKCISIEIRCEWLASKLNEHYFPTEIQAVLLKRPHNSMQQSFECLNYDFPIGNPYFVVKNIQFFNSDSDAFLS